MQTHCSNALVSKIILGIGTRDVPLEADWSRWRPCGIQGVIAIYTRQNWNVYQKQRGITADTSAQTSILSHFKYRHVKYTCTTYLSRRTMRAFSCFMSHSICSDSSPFYTVQCTTLFTSPQYGHNPCIATSLLNPISQMWGGLHMMAISFCLFLSVCLFVSLSAFKYVKSFSTWQQVYLRYTCYHVSHVKQLW